MSTFEEAHRTNAMLAGEHSWLAWQRYSILTCVEDDAVVRVDVETNDDNDDGYPDGEITTWSLTFPNVTAALKHTGACRVGISGVIVTVTLDGKEIRGE